MSATGPDRDAARGWQPSRWTRAMFYLRFGVPMADVFPNVRRKR